MLERFFACKAVWFEFTALNVDLSHQTLPDPATQWSVSHKGWGIRKQQQQLLPLLLLYYTTITTTTTTTTTTATTTTIPLVLLLLLYYNYNYDYDYCYNSSSSYNNIFARRGKTRHNTTGHKFNSPIQQCVQPLVSGILLAFLQTNTILFQCKWTTICTWIKLIFTWKSLH